MASPADSLPENAVTEPGAKRMADEDIESLLRKFLESGIKYRDDHLTPAFELAQKLYEGDKNLGDLLKVRPNRSQFVSRDVMDTIMAVLPQVIEAFFGNDEAFFDFKPTRQETQDQAREATEYVNYLIRKHGDLELFINVFLDTFKSKVGPILYTWDKSKRVTFETYSMLTKDEYEALLAPEEEGTEVEPQEVTSRTLMEMRPVLDARGQMQPDPMNPQTPLMGEQPVEYFDCQLKISREYGQIKYTSVKPEERVIDASGECVKDMRYWFRVRQISRSDLISRGYDADVVNSLAVGDDFLTEELYEKRENALQRSDRNDDDNLDPSMQTVPVAEGFVRLDLDKDGIAELYSVCVAGRETKLLGDPVPVEEIQVAEVTVIPVEHVATGNSLADRVQDIQVAKTSLWRNMFDSLGQALFPQRGFDMNRVSLPDLMNEEAGALIRCNGAPNGLVQEFNRSFVGKECLSVLGAMDEMHERRIGTSRTASGLDADGLQSTTKVAADAVVAGHQMQVKMFVRIMSIGFKALAKGTLRLLCRHQREIAKVQIGDDWRQFDPRNWDPDMDVVVRSNLGAGLGEEKKGSLGTIFSIQEKGMTVGAPIVDWTKIYNTIEETCKLYGWKDASKFFIKPNPQNSKPPNPQENNPESMLAKAQMVTAETERKTSVEKNRTERIKVLLDDDRERDKLEADIIAKFAEIRSKAGGSQPWIDAAEIRALQAISRERNYGEVAARVLAMDSPIGDPQQPQQGQLLPPGAPQR